MPKRPASIADEWEGNEEMIRIKQAKSDARLTYAESDEANELIAALRRGEGGSPDWDDVSPLPKRQRHYVWEDDE